MGTLTRFIVPLIVLVGVGVVAYRTSGPGRAAPTPEVFTSTDLTASLAAASGQTPPGLVIADFTASWCGPCQQMKKQTWPDAGVSGWIKANATAVLVDTDAHPREAQANNISGIPAIVVYRGQKEIARAVGFQSPAQLLTFLEAAKAK